MQTRPITTGTLILTPTPAEARPVARALGLQRVGHGRWAGDSLTLQVVGVGFAAAERLPHLPHDPASSLRVLIAGLAGALTPQLTTGDVVRPARVLAETAPPIHLDAADPQGPTLLSLESIITKSADKSRCHDNTGAAAIDMETYAIAQRLAGRASVCALRVISDDAHTTLPPGIERWLYPNGDIDPWGITLSLLAHPTHVWATSRFMRQAAHATTILAEAVVHAIDEDFRP